MDSPKCLFCLDNGKVGQTYKIAGQAKFQCQSCKRIYQASEFEPVEFQWKTDPVAWNEWFKNKLKEKNVAT